MYINPLTGKPIADKKAVAKAKAGQSSQFFDLLTSQLLPNEEAPSVQGPTASSLEGPQVSTELRLAGLSMSENTIELLESFSQALANLQLEGRDLLPLIEALEGDTTTLLDIREQLPSHDPLAQLIDRVTTVSALEAEKFRRGDYC